MYALEAGGTWRQFPCSLNSSRTGGSDLGYTELANRREPENPAHELVTYLENLCKNWRCKAFESTSKAAVKEPQRERRMSGKRGANPRSLGRAHEAVAKQSWLTGRPGRRNICG